MCNVTVTEGFPCEGEELWAAKMQRRAWSTLAAALIVTAGCGGEIGDPDLSEQDYAITTGHELEVVAVTYDRTAGAIIPCVKVPRGFYTAATLGSAPFEIEFDIHYVSGGESVEIIPCLRVADTTLELDRLSDPGTEVLRAIIPVADPPDPDFPIDAFATLGIIEPRTTPIR